MKEVGLVKTVSLFIAWWCKFQQGMVAHAFHDFVHRSCLIPRCSQHDNILLDLLVMWKLFHCLKTNKSLLIAYLVRFIKSINVKINHSGDDDKMMSTFWCDDCDAAKNVILPKTSVLSYPPNSQSIFPRFIFWTVYKTHSCSWIHPHYQSEKSSSDHPSSYPTTQGIKMTEC